MMVRATDAGHRQLLRWALREFAFVDELRFAVEDCRHVSTRLEPDLLGAGQVVVRVPPQLMAGARQGARTRGKSDPIDALAIARAALREPKPWRARCAERRTAGSARGSGKRTRSNPGTAPRAYSADPDEAKSARCAS